jgi:hypothetical protein
MTVSLYPVAASGGVQNAHDLTLGPLVAGSAVAFPTPPDNSMSRDVSADFDVPADGFHVLAVTIDTATAADSFMEIGATLQMHHV